MHYLCESRNFGMCDVLIDTSTPEMTKASTEDTLDVMMTMNMTMTTDDMMTGDTDIQGGL